MIPFSRPSEWLYLEGTCHEVGHTWNRSCLLANLELCLAVTYEGFKLYLPLYLVSHILRERSVRGVLKVLPHVLRSSAFLGCNAMGVLLFICVFRRLIGRFYLYSSVFLPCVFGTACALMVERKSRRPLLAGYVATVALELLYSVLKMRKLVPSIPYGEVLMFSLASAVTFHRYRTHPRGGDVITSILRGLMLPQPPLMISSFFRTTNLDNRLSHIILVGLWAFVLGYLLQTIISLFSQGKKLFNERGTLKKVFTSSRSIRFAAFLSSLTAGYKVVSSLLFYVHLPRDVRLLLAGLVAGLSMLFYRSTPLSLYVAWKALEVVYSRGVEEGWLKYIPYGDVLIYSLSTGYLLHGWFFESHNMRWTYWNFMRRASRGRLLQVNYNELDKFGTGASTRPREWKEHVTDDH